MQSALTQNEFIVFRVIDLIFMIFCSMQTGQTMHSNRNATLH
jgi:hypothetical protein